MRKLKMFLTLSLLGMAIMVASGSSAAGEAAPDEMTGLAVGEKVSDFTLKNQDGEEVSLTSLLAKDGTTALVFHRSANW
ncbi:MAG: hypothetical protein VCD00_02515 [Candidatus Hydrogenedentota bacterium]